MRRRRQLERPRRSRPSSRFSQQCQPKTAHSVIFLAQCIELQVVFASRGRSMRVVQRVCAGLSGLVVALAGCGAVDPGNVGVSSSSDPLTVPYSATDLGAGSVKYSVTLPSGQHYVEVFARKNGVQNTAHDITTSGVANNDGTTTYSYVKSSCCRGRQRQYRFYSYVGPRVFTVRVETAWSASCTARRRRSRPTLRRTCSAHRKMRAAAAAATKSRPRPARRASRRTPPVGS